MRKSILFFTNDERDLVGIKYPLIKAIIDNESFDSIIFLSPGGGAVPKEDYDNKFPGQNIILETVDMNLYSYNPLREIRVVYQVWRCIRKHNPMYIFSMAIKPIVSIGLVMLLDSKSRRSFALFSGLGRAFINRSAKIDFVRLYVETILRIALMKYSTTAFQNIENMDYFVVRKIIRRRQAFLCNGTGVDTFEFKRESRVAAVPNNIVMISRIIKSKGIYEYCEAANTLSKSNSNLKFTLAGPMEPTNEGINDDELSRILGVVEYIGYTSDVKRVLEEQDLFVLPTNYPEGVPRSLLEAQSMNIPAITTNTPGCNAVIEHKFNGLLTSDGSAQGIISSIKFCLENPKIYQTMAKNSRKKIKDYFEISSVNNAVTKRFLG